MEKHEEPERWVDGYWGGLRKVSMTNGQAGSVCDELGARVRRHAPPAIRWRHLGHGQKLGKIAGTAGTGGSLDSIRESDLTWQRG